MDPNLEDLFNEVRLLFNALVQRGENIHSDQPLTMAQRAVMEYLLKAGPSAVPAIARQRRVSRQHIQTLVNPLLESGYLMTADNPEHKLSRLVDLTDAGRKTIVAMRNRESRYFDQTDVGVSRQRLCKAADTLRALRSTIEADQ